MSIQSDPNHEKSSSPRRWWIPGLAFAVLLGIGWVILLPGYQRAGNRPMSSCQRNMKMIGLALHQYHEEFGCFPPANVRDQNGQSMHSWRALILPYLAALHEDDAKWLKSHRYDFGFWKSFDFRSRERLAMRKANQIKAVLAEYDFSQPWNASKNRPLSQKTLEAFCCDHGGSDSNTDYLAVVGNQTAWPNEGEIKFADFHDGVTNTILVVESIDSGINWSEPRDLKYDSKSTLINDMSGQGLRGPYPSGANALYADTYVGFLSTEMTADNLKAMFTIKEDND